MNLAKYVKNTMTPTPEGTPVKEVMPPAAAWALGAAPFPPTPAERHVPVGRKASNPAPEGASQSTKRMEWRAHKAAARALENGTLEPLGGGPKDHRPFPGAQMHHPDYRKPLQIEWESAKQHEGLPHLPADRGQEIRVLTPEEDEAQYQASLRRLERRLEKADRRNPEEAGRSAARSVFERFHERAPGRTFRMDIPDMPAELPMLGQCEEIVYSVPEGIDSSRNGYRWRHKFGDTGDGDTHAKPYILSMGEKGPLVIVSKPDEQPFELTERGIVG